MATTEALEKSLSAPPGFRVAVVCHIGRADLGERVGRAFGGLAEALAGACGPGHGYTVMSAGTREGAEDAIAGHFADGPRTAAILVSDRLSNEPTPGRMNDRPRPTHWALRVLEQFQERLFGTVAVTRWARRVPDIDRTVGREMDRDALLEALVKTVRTLQYKAPPPRLQLGEPVLARVVRTKAELESYFRLRHRVYSVMGYLPNDLEVARSGLEIDWCDRNSIPIGVFRAGPGASGVLGTSRIILTKPALPEFERWSAELCRDDPVVRRRFEKALTLQLPIMQSQDLDGTLVEIYRKNLRCCELSRVIVADECRGTGLSGVLIRFALLVVGRLGIDRVYLECLPGHAPLYEKFGFRRLPIAQKRVVDVNKTMIAMELACDPAVAPQDPAGPSDWIGRSYLCCCARRECYTRRYELYGTSQCPLVENRYYHSSLCRTINLGRLGP